jgi:cation diffusion facilitator family transporter
MKRSQKIIATSIIGILANVFLAAFKAAVGIIAGSIAITMDAVNNLSDAMNSVITLIGTKLSEKEPDRKHPYGYGRIEYLTSLIIGVVIFYAGLMSFISSAKAVLEPTNPDYSTASIVIIIGAVFVKIALGFYTKKIGKTLDSNALTASGKDALIDSLLSSATLISAVIYLVAHVNIEAYVGVLISFMILKAGFEALKDTVDDILGARIPAELSRAVKISAASFPEVNGVFDLVIHNYGKEQLVGSFHIEVPDSLKALYLSGLERKISEKVYKDTGVSITAISIYSHNLQDEFVKKVRVSISDILKNYPEVLQMHGLYVNDVDKEISFDIVVDFDTKNKLALADVISDKVRLAYPGYNVVITVDYDISD